LILILLVMAVSLTLGVSVASRSITALRQVSFLGQSAQALAFAEGGAEDALKCLNDGGSCPDSGPVDLDGDGGKDFEYHIFALGGAVLDSFPALARNETVELNLRGYASGVPVNIYWVKSSDSAEVSDPAAVEITAVYLESGVYKVSRYAYDPDAVRAAGNGFSSPTSGSFNVNGVIFKYRVSVTPPAAPIALRIKPLYSDKSSSFAFEAASGTLPSQGSRIESTGFSGRVIRKIEVIRTGSALSEIFDYVLFSGSGSSSLVK
jgi:hypothetical protein